MTNDDGTIRAHWPPLPKVLGGPHVMPGSNLAQRIERGAPMEEKLTIPDDLQALHDLATKANPGPWCSDYAYSAIRHVCRNCDIECSATHDENGCPGAFGRYDGPYVAAANPDCVKGLIERIARVQAERDWLREALNEAGRSLRYISENAGKDEFLQEWHQVRGYANSRATVAEVALRAKESSNG